MKKLFFSLVALAVAAMSYAQSTLVATLSHDGNITTFFGSEAFKNAYNASVADDIITLSSGTFEGTNIMKKLTIRGAGMQNDTQNGIPSTIITKAITINGEVSLEGISFGNGAFLGQLKNTVFKKINFGVLKGVDHKIRDAEFINCRVKINSCFYYSQNLSFINCYVEQKDVDNYFGSSGEPDDQFCFLNCYVCVENPKQQYHCYFRNCIIDSKRTSAFNNECFVLNSLARKEDLLKNQATNYVVTDDIFIPNSFYELTDEAKMQYLGDDGTEVGLYGGVQPYNPFPSNPKITKFNVASRTTSDGKLSVDIEVKAAE